MERDAYKVFHTEDGQSPLRQKVVEGEHYVLLGGSLYVVKDPTPDEIRGMYTYWIRDHELPYDLQNGWVREVGANTAVILKERYGGRKELDGPVLDLACGTGLVMEGLTQHVRPTHLVGIDITDAALQSALSKPTLTDYSFVHADVRDLPFRPHTFAAVTGSLFINHIPSADWTTLFTNVRELLADGGAFILVDTPNHENADLVMRELHRIFPYYELRTYSHASINGPDGFSLNYHIAATPQATTDS